MRAQEVLDFERPMFLIIPVRLYGLKFILGMFYRYRFKNVSGFKFKEKNRFSFNRKGWTLNVER